MVRRLSPIEYDRAVRRARRKDLTEPRARSAYYDRRSGQVVVELSSGAKFMFPTDLAQGIAGASVNDLSRIEISPSGEGLCWPTLDADFSLPELMRGVFGTKAWMQSLKRQSKKVPGPTSSTVRVKHRDSQSSSS
jgi:hypothetical protein